MPPISCTKTYYTSGPIYVFIFYCAKISFNYSFVFVSYNHNNAPSEKTKNPTGIQQSAFNLMNLGLAWGWANVGWACPASCASGGRTRRGSHPSLHGCGDALLQVSLILLWLEGFTGVCFSHGAGTWLTVQAHFKPLLASLLLTPL